MAEVANENDPLVGLATVLDGLTPWPGKKTYSSTYLGLIQTGDGLTLRAMIKDLPVPDLIRELIGAAIARRTKVAIPRPFLAIANEDTLATAEGPLMGRHRLVFASQVIKGEQFFTAYQRHPLPTKLLDALAGWNDLPTMFAFDTWLANIDRHAGNIMVRPPMDFCAIDHGHCFNGPHTNVEGLDPALSYRNQLAEWLVPTMALDAKLSFLGALSNLPSSLLNFDLDDALDQSHAFRIPGSPTKASVLQFLLPRHGNLAALNSAVLGAKP